MRGRLRGRGGRRRDLCILGLMIGKVGFSVSYIEKMKHFRIEEEE